MGGDGISGNVDERDRGGQAKALGAGAAGVEVEDAVAPLDRGLVRVAADHGGDAGGFRFEVEITDGVDEVKELPGQIDGFGGRELGAGPGGVDVAANGGDGADLAESVEDAGVADIARVEDVFSLRKRGEGLGAKEAVGVRDDADQHGYGALFGGAGSGDAERLESGEVDALTRVVPAVRIDAQIEDADAAEVDAVVLDLFGRPGRAKGELLPEDLAEVVCRRAGVERELLGAFGGAINNVELDSANGLRRVEEDEDPLRAGVGSAPAGGGLEPKCVLDREELVLGGYFDAGEVFEVEPGVVRGVGGSGRGRFGTEDRFAHKD